MKKSLLLLLCCVLSGLAVTGLWADTAPVVPASSTPAAPAATAGQGTTTGKKHGHKHRKKHHKKPASNTAPTPAPKS